MIDLDRLDELPRKGSMRRTCGSKEWYVGFSYGRYRRESSFDTKNKYGLVNKVLAKFIDSPFDEAYSFFCKQTVDITWKEEFVDSVLYEGRGYFTKIRSETVYPGSIYLDEDGIIRKSPETSNKRRRFKSIDYEIERIPKRPWYYYKKKFKAWKYDMIKDLPEEPKYKIISGYSLDFYSKSNEFIKLQSEKRDSIRKNNRIESLEESKVVYQFLTKEELNKKQSEEDLITRDRLGFTKDSFTGYNYHGQKRKKRTNVSS